ncbi:MAG: Zn-dependent protease [halophilic archaeon J07HX5]|jgi:Zn-dependent proteases|nr:MAG: Zn-dependent protease [halophilic archaeon J07HX5]
MRGLHIGTIAGIPVRLNWTFLVVLPVFAFLIGTDITMLTDLLEETLGRDIAASTLEGSYRPWLLGLAAAVGLFGGVLLHELGHSLVALRFGCAIESITLWLLGGLASFDEMPENWRQEFWIAVAGPVVSVGVGLAFFAAFLAVPSGVNELLFVFGYLAVVNVALAAFNMLPAFPMDGGRVLRALLARNRSRVRATRLAAGTGKVFAVGFAIVGVFANLFLVVLAVFVYIAAAGEAKQTVFKAAFDNVTVGQLMTDREALETVRPDATVAALIQRMFAESHTGYPVVGEPGYVGIVTLDAATSVPEVEREAYLVEDVMQQDVTAVRPTTGAMTALEAIQQEDTGRLLVVDDDRLVGLISRADIMRGFNIIQSGGQPRSPDESRRGGPAGELTN